MGKKTQKVQNTNAPPQYIQNAQQQVINQANQLASQPLQQYAGPQVAGFTPAQLQSFDTINSLQGSVNPWLNAASQYTGSAANSIANQIPLLGSDATSGLAGTAFNTFTGGPSDILQTGMNATPGLTNTVNQATNQYMSPYLNNVVQATLNQINNQNQQQQNQLVGNAVSAGAWGGDRAGVAQGVLGGQQALASDQTIANILQQGYGQAQQTALGTLGQGVGAAAQQNQLGLGYGQAAQQGYLAQLQAAQQAASQQGLLNLYAGQQMGSLGLMGLQGNLQAAQAQQGAGALQQSLAQQQLNANIAQYQQAQAYPYQQLSFLDQIINGTAGLAGGTGTQSSPAGSWAGSLLGIGSLYNSGALSGGINGLGNIGAGIGQFLGIAGAASSGASAGASAGADVGAALLDALPLQRGGKVPKYDGGGDVPIPFVPGESPVDYLKMRNRMKLFGDPLFSTPPPPDAGQPAPAMAAGGSPPSPGVRSDLSIMRTPMAPALGNTPVPQMAMPGFGANAPLGVTPTSLYTPPPAAQIPTRTIAGNLSNYFPTTTFNGFSGPLAPAIGQGFNANMAPMLARMWGPGSRFGAQFANGGMAGYDDGGDVEDDDYTTPELVNSPMPDASFMPQSTGVGAPPLGMGQQGIGMPPAQQGSFFGTPLSNINIPQMAFGLGVLGSRGNLGQAIAQGGMNYLQALQQQRSEALQQRKEQSEEGYRTADVNARIKQLDTELEHYHSMEDIEKNRLSSENTYRQSELNLRDREMNKPQLVGYTQDGKPMWGTPGGQVTVSDTPVATGRYGLGRGSQNAFQAKYNLAMSIYGNDPQKAFAAASGKLPMQLTPEQQQKWAIDQASKSAAVAMQQGQITSPQDYNNYVEQETQHNLQLLGQHPASATAGAPSAGTGQIHQVSTKQEYDSLKPGSWYSKPGDPPGTHRVKQ